MGYALLDCLDDSFHCFEVSSGFECFDGLSSFEGFHGFSSVKFLTI